MTANQSKSVVLGNIERFKRQKVMEAYRFALDQVHLLIKKGATVKVARVRKHYSSLTFEKYNQPDRLPPRYWLNITVTSSDIDGLFQVEDNIRQEKGVSFDTGGGMAHEIGHVTREWSFDWSFHLRL